MDGKADVAANALCAAIEAAIRLAEERDDTLVSALLSEAYDAARCEEQDANPGL